MSLSATVFKLEGRLVRLARLRDEWYEFVDDPKLIPGALAEQRLAADLVTFIQRIPERQIRFPFFHEWDQAAIVTIESYEKWWKHVINDKTRNMIRKAEKKGITLRTVPFDDQLVRGIARIYNECPVRQGRPFKHYGKDLETLRREHATFLDRSDFIGAFLGDELVGFVKLVHQDGWSCLMQIISLIAHRDKAPTNALIARAIAVCAERGIPYLQYGIWSRRGIGEFKKHHGFECFPVARYYVPLTVRGRLSLSLGLHRSLADRIPEAWLDRFLAMRAKWISRRYTEAGRSGAVAQSAEQRAQA